MEWKPAARSLSPASGLVTALCLLSTTPAGAATYDPDLRWRTLRTEHFNIHFHQGIEALADEFSSMVEVVYDQMTEELQWELRGRVELTLIDRTDSANGFATTVPYNAITIYVTAPTEDSTLNLYEDWATAIFTHELTHVVHMETNHGIVRAARAVVGRVASTNDVSPGWMIEGFATFQETRHTAGGRGRASWPDMIKRTAVVEDDFPPLGNLDGYQPTLPAGNLRYLFGEDFIRYIAEHTGRDVWTRWTHTYGSSVPFLFPSKKVFGRRLVPLYHDWRQATIDEYEAQAAAIRAEGETIGRLVSDPDASCVAPAFSPDGDKLVWSCLDLKTGSAIWMSDGMGYAPELLLQDFGAGYFTWRADSKAFVYASTHIVNQFNVWSDIYMHTLGSSSSVALTSGARARDPDFSPDGSRLLYVTNRAQDNQLQLMTVDRRQRTLTDNQDHVQYSTPRHAPSGEVVALSVWEDGRRDLWLYSPEGEPLRRVTMDAAIDADPVWSADGRWLFFSSDRSSVPNIYAIELATERLYRVTNVVTGAVKPTVHPDGSRIAYMQYSRDGWDIRVLELDPGAWADLGLLPRPLRYGTPLHELVPPPSATGAEVSASAPEPVGEGDPALAPSLELGPRILPPSAPAPQRPQPPGGAAPEPAPPGSSWALPGPAPAAPTRPLSPAHSHPPQRAARAPARPPRAALSSPALSGPPLRLPLTGATLQADGASGLHRPGPRGPHPQSTDVLDNFEDTVVEDVFGEEQDYPFQIEPRRYNPLPTLLPRYALPYFQTTPYRPSERWGFTCLERETSLEGGGTGITPVFCQGLRGTLVSSASDALRRYSWGASVNYRTDADYVGASAAFSINRFLPVYTLGVSTAAVPGPQLSFYDPAAPLDEDGELQLLGFEPPIYYWGKHTSAYGVVSWPYRLRTTIFAQYSITDRRPRFPLDGYPLPVYLPSVPLIGFVGALSGGWRYSWSRQTSLAISVEDGRIFSLTGSLLSPLLGTFVQDEQTGQLRPLTQLQLASELREYVVNPWLPNHVLAGRVAGGVTLGGAEFLGNYLLGGSLSDTGFSVAPDSLRMVRGYPIAYDVGDMYWLASLEYRLPLWYLNRGVGTLPAFGRNVSAAVFVDAGNAFNNPSVASGTPSTVSELGSAAITAPLIGVGAELTWRAIVVWGVSMQGRIGYAVGLTEGGYGPLPDGALGNYPLYLQLGGSF